ncbi:MAG: TylF/MycF/NovP-related O-methyltransferase [Alphaproteobacteria bacterium]
METREFLTQSDDVLAKWVSEYFTSGRFDEVLPILKELHERHSQQWGILNMIGSVLEQQGDFEGAAAHLVKAFSLVPENPVILNNYAQVLLRLNRLEESFDTFKRLLTLDPGSDRARAGLREIRGRQIGIDYRDGFRDIGTTLFRGVQYMFGYGVEGDIAEFGTQSGSSAEVLAYAASMVNRNLGGLRVGCSVYLFDSFEGLPACDTDVDLASPLVQSGIWGPGACAKGLNPQELRQRCEIFLPPEQVLIFEGWFRDTVPTLSDTVRFGVVHVDCDLYASTMDALTPLFERRLIAKGALVLFDDWNCNHASPEFGERRAWQELVERFNIAFSDEGGYAIASHKFIVHDYS